MEFILTVLDTVSIQPYIFSSNRLQEMIGASELVTLATREWVFEVLEELWPGQHNVQDSKSGQLDKDRCIENPQSGLIAEVIYADGGNTLILFASQNNASDFTTRLSTKMLTDAPGLRLAVAHTPMQWQDSEKSKTLARTAITLIEQHLAARKQILSDPLPLSALSVTAACQSTGGPAAQTDLGLRTPGERSEAIRRISRETAAKLSRRSQHNKRLKRLFGSQLGGIYDFPNEFDHLVPEERSESYLAVVHADGNGMGKHIRTIAEVARDNRTFINALREFSISIKQAGENALRCVVEALARMSPTVLRPRDDFLPFRPLIFGGDDVTFVCRGDLGVSLAALYLEEFEKATIKGLLEEEIHPHACAGIAIVKTHYPFSLAYRLAEDLCRNAKQSIKVGDYSVLDWHFTATGIFGSLKSIRAAQYTLPDLTKLYLRPLRLRPDEDDVEGKAWYGQVETLVAEFALKWRPSRNKVKDLYEALRSGPEKVAEFRRTYRLDLLPEVIPNALWFRENGFSGDQCGYFDALELMDHYLRVEPVR